MPVCLSFAEIIEGGKPQIAHLEDVGQSFSSLPAEDPRACVAFSKEVRLLESVLTCSYTLAVSVVRRTEDLREVAETWKEMESLCTNSLEVLKKWKERYPYCGTPELFDLALDYKLACAKRYSNAIEEIACLTQNFPKGLFPEPI
jgi:hypothetical protein